MKKLRFPKFLFISIALLTSLFIQAQNVGIGTTAPSAGLEIVTSGNTLNALRVATNQAYNANPDVGIGFRFKYNTAGAYTSGAVISALKENNTDGNESGNLRFLTNNAGTIAERMRITSGGNVGIGTNLPQVSLDVVGTGQFVNNSDNTVLISKSSNTGGTIFDLENTSSGGRKWRFYSTGSGNGEGAGNLLFHNSSNVCMILSGGGNVGIGTSSPGYKLDVQGGGINASGGFTTSSDARLKTVLQSWTNSDQIDFIQYRWKNESDNREHYGYLAQDVQKVLPDAVHIDNEGLMSVNYDEVHSYKLAMQEQRIKELEQTVDELKKMIKRKRPRRKA